MTETERKLREALDAAQQTLRAYQAVGAAHAFVGDISLVRVEEIINAALALPSDGWRTMENARPLDEWCEEDGNVLWWKFPLDEPPYCGSPLDIGHTVHVQITTNQETRECLVQSGGWPGYHTHWTRMPVPASPTTDRSDSDG